MTEQKTQPNVRGEVVALLRDELASIKIPPRPLVLESLEKEVRSPAPNYESLAKIISLDVGLSASLLKIANSAAFGYSGRIRSVQQALHALGLESIVAAISALSLRKSFAHVPNLERFWDSSACIAQISAWLATRVRIPDQRVRPEEAYTFGLFRDCGIPVLMANFSDYIEVLKLANAAESQPFTAVEDDDMGVNHAMIGAKLAKEWRMPDEFRSAIDHHHDADAIVGDTGELPDIARHFIALSQFAEYIFQRLSGMNQTREWGKLGAACMSALHLDEAAVEGLLAQAMAQRTEFGSDL